MSFTFILILIGLLVHQTVSRPYQPQPTGESLLNICPGPHEIFAASTGEIFSPFYEQNFDYPASTNCTWIITVPDGKVVELNFTDFELEEGQSDSCYDVVRVHDLPDGPEQTSSAVSLQALCGYHLTLNTFVSTGSSMMVSFSSDQAIQRRGFHATFKAITSRQSGPCGKSVQLREENDGEIYTPNYDAISTYSNNQKCRWRIKAPVGMRVVLVSLSFDLQVFPRCRADRLVIKDGFRQQSRLLVKACGYRTTNPIHVESTGRYMFLLFKTDDSVVKTGFHLHYYFVGDSSAGSSGTSSTTSSTISATTLQTTTISPTTLRTTTSTAMVTTPITTSTSTSTATTVPTTTISISTSTLSPGPPPGPPGANVNKDPCDGSPVIITSRGTFTSPGFGSQQKYLNNLNCAWKIAAPSNNKVTISFKSFDLEPSSGGGRCWDSLTAYDGPSSRSNRLRQLCGSPQPTPRDISSSAAAASMYLVFSTDSSETASGFKIEVSFKEMCSASEFQCFNDQCIANEKKCDGQDDCSDGSDEALYHCKCGVPTLGQNSPNRIIGGVTSKAHAWPWMARLLSRGSAICGASLINPQWVLTAAHCVHRSSASSLSIRFGDHNSNLNERSQVTLAVSRVISHENYDSDTVDNDIALLKLERPVILSPEVSQICLPGIVGELLANGTNCTVTGWGTVGGSTQGGHILQQLSLPLLSSATCRSQSKYEASDITDNMICLGGKQAGKDSCQGDSGGPLVCPINGQWRQVGIVSWGRDCAKKDLPGVYTHVSNYAQWIELKMSQN